MFKVPRKAIFNTADLNEFKKSKTYSEILVFVRRCNEAVLGRGLRDDSIQMPAAGQQIIELLTKLEDWTACIPPCQQAMRFGNAAFRTWHARLASEAPELIATLLPDQYAGASIELVPYFTESFGNPTRIDYGTGHETNFVAFLYCLARLGLFEPRDMPAIVLGLFDRYMRLMRVLQATYLLEPAGSHGVWGLDDYHCLPFLWGSAQLTGHPTITPSAITDDALCEQFQDDFMYLKCVSVIKSVKNGASFSETSPVLYSISSSESWRKINVSLLKLYTGEVLEKLPVIQHFLFGSLLPNTWNNTDASELNSGSMAQLHTRSSLPGYLMAAETAQRGEPTATRNSANHNSNNHRPCDSANATNPQALQDSTGNTCADMALSIESL